VREKEIDRWTERNIILKSLADSTARSIFKNAAKLFCNIFLQFFKQICLSDIWLLAQDKLFEKKKSEKVKLLQT
jgi:hypothetical protein